MGGFLKDQFLILLSHAADDPDDLLRAIAFTVFQTPQCAVDFVFCVFANAAGVEQNGICVFGVVCQQVAFATQCSDNQFAVQHIHLAANGFDVQSTIVRRSAADRGGVCGLLLSSFGHSGDGDLCRVPGQ